MIATWAKAFVRPLYARLPLSYRAPSLYWNTRRLLNESQFWNEERLAEHQLGELRKMLRHCAVNVPYYRRLFRKIGFDPDDLRDLSGMNALPTLSVEQIRSKPDDFLADNIPARERRYFTTGGTMGRPLGLYNLKGAGWRERAFIHTQWERVGFRPGHKRAILRGGAVRSSDLWTFDPAENAYVFSNFHLMPQNAARYAALMKEKQLRFFHCYPSSAIDFARCLRQLQVVPPKFHVILAGSENLYPGQREQIEEFYGCRLFTWYGHSENVVLAAECEASKNYHVFPEYGFVELIREDGMTAREGEAGEFVGTSFFNAVMPLVRYRTGDWGIVGPKHCSCGRNHVLVSQVRGRWNQEMLVGRHGNLISFTAINVHTPIFDNVKQFQLRQGKKGVAELRVVRKPSYTAKDSSALLKGLGEKLADSVDLQLVFVDEIPLTARGKFRFVVQELNFAGESGGAEHARPI